MHAFAEQAPRLVVRYVAKTAHNHAILAYVKNWQLQLAVIAPTGKAIQCASKEVVVRQLRCAPSFAIKNMVLNHLAQLIALKNLVPAHPVKIFRTAQWEVGLRLIAQICSLVAQIAEPVDIIARQAHSAQMVYADEGAATK